MARIDISMKRGDRRPSLTYDLTEPDGTPAPVAGSTVRFWGKLRGGSKVIGGTAAIVTASATLTRVRYDWQTTDTDTAGDFDCEWEVEDGTGTKESYPALGYLTMRITADLG